MTLRHQIMSGLRWSVGVRFASQIFTWAITLIVVRLLSPADYGLLAMAMMFVAFLYMIAEFGMGPSVVQQAEITLPRTAQGVRPGARDSRIVVSAALAFSTVDRGHFR